MEMKRTVQRRIESSREVMEEFFRNIFKGEVSALSAEKDLPYGLIYNLVHARIHSLSAADYRRIFGQEPPQEKTLRVDGAYFRGMVRLWIFLNGEDTKKDLYREPYPDKGSLKRVDYRIFTGKTGTVEGRIEGIMERKLRDRGLTGPEIIKWIEEVDQIIEEERIPYEEARPVLDYLQNTLDIHPTRLLNQSAPRYETGKLRTVAKSVYERLRDLQERTERAAKSGSAKALEKLKEEVYGERKGMTLFSDVEEELRFIKARTGRGSRKYPGRGTSPYRKSELKRIATWRAREIRKDCEEIINERPGLKIKAVPSFFRAEKIKGLLRTLKHHLMGRMMGAEGLELERKILTPDYRLSYAPRDGHQGLVSFEHVFLRLGMSKRAFDLLVANHGDILKRIGIYVKGWKIPKSYLEALLEKEDFQLVREKYEWLARTGMSGVFLKKQSESRCDPEAGDKKVPSWAQAQMATGGEIQSPIPGEGCTGVFQI
jgi:hypothetical protein